MGARVGGDAQLEADYAACRLICEEHARTFAFAARPLPPDRRRAIWAIYAFCRQADDLVDRRDPAAAREALTGWREELLRTHAGAPGLPTMHAYADTVRRFGVPLEPALDLLRGVEMDLTPVAYETWEELAVYCYRVASTVGLLTLPVLGARSPTAAGYAIDLGIAMQLTNILRDVGEDARLGRIYLPRAEMRRFGYEPERLMGGVVDEAFRELMRFQIARARDYYARAAPGIGLLDRGARLPVQLASTLYSQILARIEANNCDVFSRRAHLSMTAKLYHSLLAVPRLARLAAHP